MSRPLVTSSRPGKSGDYDVLRSGNVRLPSLHVTRVRHVAIGLQLPLPPDTRSRHPPIGGWRANLASLVAFAGRCVRCAWSVGRSRHPGRRKSLRGAGGDTFPCMQGSRTNERQRLATLAVAVETTEIHRNARLDERESLDARDRSIVAAVRAGALLAEIAEAAGITRAAASLAARRNLPPRTGRGGPYARRRGTAAAVRSVAEAAQHLGEAKEKSAAAKRRRDLAIAAAVAGGTGLGATARALGMTTPAVSTIARSGTHDVATKNTGGAVASP